MVRAAEIAPQPISGFPFDGPTRSVEYPSTRSTNDVEEGPVSVTEEQRDGLVERLFAATLGMSEVLTVYLGDTLGLYRALDRNGPMTAPQLASETGIFPRYAREWLEQ
jgi:hypothetical protein